MTDPDAFCRECGTAISELATDCPECGAPQSDDTGDGRLSLFAALLSAALGIFAFAIVFGTVAAVAGYDAYRKQGRTLAAAACAVGVVEALIGAWAIFTAMGGI